MFPKATQTSFDIYICQKKKEQPLKANSSLLTPCGPINKERYMACTAPKGQHYI